MKSLLLVAAAALVAPVATAAVPDPAVARAVSALARAQQDFAEIEASWSWRAGMKRPAPNTAGLVALGLIRAAARTPSQKARVAAISWGEARLSDHAAWRPLYDPDIEALVALAGLTGDSRYRATAVAAFDRRWGGASGEEALAKLDLQRRRQPSIVGFDTALTIRAAVAVEDIGFAHTLAGATLATKPAWSRPPDRDPNGYSTTSKAAVLDALFVLDRRRYADAIGNLAADLVLGQHDEGSWSGRNTQATAYAVRALARLGGPSSELAVERGARWLTRTQLENGAWATFHDGLPEPFVGDVMHEVTAEVVLALEETAR